MCWFPLMLEAVCKTARTRCLNKWLFLYWFPLMFEALQNCGYPPFHTWAVFVLKSWKIGPFGNEEPRLQNIWSGRVGAFGNEKPPLHQSWKGRGFWKWTDPIALNLGGVGFWKRKASVAPIMKIIEASEKNHEKHKQKRWGEDFKTLGKNSTYWNRPGKQTLRTLIQGVETLERTIKTEEQNWTP